RCSVVPVAGSSTWEPAGPLSRVRCHRVLSTVTGPGRTYSGLRWAHTTACQPRKNSPMAVSFGHSPSQAAIRRPRAGATGTSRASRPAISAPRCSARTSPGRWLVSRSSAMAAHLLTEPVGDHTGQCGHLGVVEAPGTGDVDAEPVDDPAGAAGEHQHPVAEADGLPDVVGDED